MIFEKLDNIDIKKTNTWKGKIFLTIDLEWASDVAINFLIDLLLSYDVKATFFLTHDSLAVRRILKNKKNFSIGLHPNFNNLLENREKTNKNYKSVFINLQKKFKKAKIVRSHSLVNSSKLTSYYKQKGIKFISNELCYKIKNLKPWKDYNGIINLPIIWADDIALYLKDINNNLKFINHKNLNILDFHPTSVFINSSDFYKNKTALRKQNKIKFLKKNINDKKYGVQDFFKAILLKNIKKT